MTRKVLFLCTGNSCRSQMAEAIVNAHQSADWRAFSAGTEPTGFVHSKAIQALDEVGITHIGESKSTEKFREMDFDMVVTVCDDAVKKCPVWLVRGKRVQLGFDDPAKAQGTDQEQLAAFRSVRDAIILKVPELLEQF